MSLARELTVVSKIEAKALGDREHGLAVWDVFNCSFRFMIT
jgi:hypothetical protein